MYERQFIPFHCTAVLIQSTHNLLEPIQCQYRSPTTAADGQDSHIISLTDLLCGLAAIAGLSTIVRAAYTQNADTGAVR